MNNFFQEKPCSPLERATSKMGVTAYSLGKSFNSTSPLLQEDALKMPKMVKMTKMSQNLHICSSDSGVKFDHFSREKVVTPIFDVALSNGEHDFS